MKLRCSTETLSKKELSGLNGGLKKFKKANPKKFPAEITQGIQNAVKGLRAKSSEESSTYSDSGSDSEKPVLDGLHQRRSPGISSLMSREVRVAGDKSSSGVENSVHRAEGKASQEIPLSHPELREEAIMHSLLEQVLAQANVTNADNNFSFESDAVPQHLKTPKSVLKIYHEARLAQRNEKGWSTISNSVQLVHGDNVHDFAVILRRRVVWKYP